LCNLAWGIIDAAFYLIACFTERGHNYLLLRKLQQCTDAAQAQKLIEEALPDRIADAFQPADFERIHGHLQQSPLPTSHSHLTRNDWLGALSVLLLVFLSTLPVVIPFVFISNARLALHVSNFIAIVLLFATGHMLARYAGLYRIWTGVAMVIIGAALVAITIALGG
jgi:VIT1/CCC1 family predicted Fe2+/Mn2+ transporter